MRPNDPVVNVQVPIPTDDRYWIRGTEDPVDRALRRLTARAAIYRRLARRAQERGDFTAMNERDSIAEAYEKSAVILSHEARARQVA